MATIQFIQGINENVIPDVKLTRSKDGNNGTATFRFNKPDILKSDMQDKGNITGMYLNDEEGSMITKEVNAKFVNGRPQAIEATYIIKNPKDWDRFMRFMERYANENELSFTKAS
uniref:photosystem II protein psb28 n=1 Tax=Caulacanthus ustulatus TaxID=31411 RepID=UPI0027DAA841|nr:photosystem II protein psb28 [Caulacanthus ustulatus]WCH57414.1 photosystem II protein psb28 [Caulacanthus ustulatus]